MKPVAPVAVMPVTSPPVGASRAAAMVMFWPLESIVAPPLRTNAPEPAAAPAAIALKKEAFAAEPPYFSVPPLKLNWLIPTPVAAPAGEVNEFVVNVPPRRLTIPDW